MRIKKTNYFTNIILNKKPFAKAEISGGPLAPSINGTVSFYPVYNGTLVVAEVYNLPGAIAPTKGVPPVNPFGFHIHEGNSCEKGDPSDPFQAAKGHYNPTNVPHPLHAGDMPVLFGNNGYAFLAFFTDRFSPAQVVGRVVIIHQNPDDYRSQPAGNAGKRLACGVIRAV
ncbi:MAG TPA: superoxide dismutase family protein [Clostridiaceae bacterium]|jgi:Cu-Zn family superoxide dismutase|nr:superoxide dismutase family protein [Clostridiaceae bacterium]